MLVKLCLGSLEEKVVRGLSFLKIPCCLVYIVLWVAVSDCCRPIYGSNDGLSSRQKICTCGWDNYHRKKILNLLESCI